MTEQNWLVGHLSSWPFSLKDAHPVPIRRGTAQRLGIRRPERPSPLTVQACLDGIHAARAAFAEFGITVGRRP
jgi:hypothetical protein